MKAESAAMDEGTAEELVRLQLLEQEEGVLSPCFKEFSRAECTEGHVILQ